MEGEGEIGLALSQWELSAPSGNLNSIGLGQVPFPVQTTQATITEYDTVAQQSMGQHPFPNRQPQPFTKHNSIRETPPTARYKP
jgi:hypothetical protein